MERGRNESQGLGSIHEPSNIYDIERAEFVLLRFDKYADGVGETTGHRRPVFSGYVESGLYVNIRSTTGLIDTEDRKRDFQVAVGDVMTGDIIHMAPTAVSFRPRRPGGKRDHVTGADMSLEFALDEETTYRVELGHEECLLQRVGFDEAPQHLYAPQTFQADQRLDYLERTEVWRKRFEAMAVVRQDLARQERQRQWALARERSAWMNRALAMKVARVALEQPRDTSEAPTFADEVIRALAAKVVRTTVERPVEVIVDNLAYLDEVVLSEEIDRGVADLDYVA